MPSSTRVGAYVTKPRRTPAGLGGAGSVSSRRRPPRVITIRSDAVEPAAAARGQQLRDLGLQLGSKDVRQAQVRARTLQAVEVVGERECDTVVDADHLEHAVAAQQALVGGGDGELARGGDAPVERAQLGGLGGGVVSHARDLLRRADRPCQ